MDRRIYVLDAQPVVGFFKKEAAHGVIGELFAKAQAGSVHLRMTSVNTGEVIYAVERQLGAAAGHLALATVQDRADIVVADLELAVRAAWFKLRGHISYADCFAAALAHRDGIPLITGDPEFERVEDVVRIAWVDELTA